MEVQNNIMMALAFQSTLEKIDLNMKTMFILCLVFIYKYGQTCKNISIYDIYSLFGYNPYYERKIIHHPSYTSSNLYHSIQKYMTFLIYHPKLVSNDNNNNSDDSIYMTKLEFTNSNFYCMSLTPNTWFNIDSVEIMYSRVIEAHSNKEYFVYNIRSMEKQKIEDFLERARIHYETPRLSQLKKYLTLIIECKIVGDSVESVFTWKSKELTNNKTFDKLFVKNKKNYIDMIDNFKNKTDIYNLTSHKLGLLLYGPAGTGKTTFIKAIAHKLNRNIINIPINNIYTNEDFDDIMNMERYTYKNGSSEIMNVKDIIYVIEDIDRLECTLKLEYRKKTSGECESDDYLDFDFDIKSEESKESKESKDKSKDKNSISIMNHYKKLDRKRTKKIDLACLLNILDGVVETPGRIIIFTANHPERLDEALLRPGRIDHILHLDYMEKEQFIEMFNYFKVPYDLERVNTLFSKNIKLTCAGLENMMIKYYQDKTDPLVELEKEYL